METTIRHKLLHQIPIKREEGLWLFHNASHALVCELAKIVRDFYHKPDSATYLVMGILNYTNICVAKCDYCAFYRLPHDPQGYLLSFDQICQKIEEVVKLQGNMVGFNGGFHPKLSIRELGTLFARIRLTYPWLPLYEMTLAEFMFYCKKDKLSYAKGAQILKDMGTILIPGGGAEVLAESFRKKHSPGKFRVKDYFAAQKAVILAGLHSTATMVIGFGESLEERFEHLDQLRSFQEELQRPLPSFLCWTYKPYNNALGGKEITSEEYLKWLGICRIYLHNIPNIRTSVLTQNDQAVLGLLYGANDFDLPLEDEVTIKAGAVISKDLEAPLKQARDLGFHPHLRGGFDYVLQKQHGSCYIPSSSLVSTGTSLN